MMYRICWLIIVGAVCVVAGGIPNAQAGSSPPGEYEVKAAFLYNFAKFVEWPAEAFDDADAPLTIGVLGEDPFGDTLEQTVKGKTANGRKLAIRRFHKVRDLQPCHILFISSSEKRHLSEILDRLKGSSVLTVGEVEGFAKRGGVINFFVEDNRIRFEVNVDAAKRAKLKMSSKLLRLARIVRD
jgi:hypothetical protein